MTKLSSPRIAVVGCGPWGRNVARAFAQESALKVLVDVVPSQAEGLGKQLASDGYDRPTICNWEDTLRDPSIDAIAITTPASKHTEMAITSLAAGKHVFIEKPFALSVQDGRRIQQAATTANKLAMVGHLFQFHPAFIELKNMVSQGRLGKIRHIHSRRLGFGRIRHKEDVLWSLGAHDISMILTLTGDMPIEVTASGFFHLRSHIADIVTARLSFSSGVQAHIHVSWLFPQKERTMIVVGDTSTAVFDDCKPWDQKLCIFSNKVDWSGNIPDAVRGERETVTILPQEPLATECQHFLDCVKTGQQPDTNGEEALRVVEVLGWIESQIRQNSPPGCSAMGNRLQTGVNDISYSDDNGEPRTDVKCPNGLVSHREGPTYNAVLDRLDEKPIEIANEEVSRRTNQIPLVNLTAQRMKIQDHLNLRLANVFNHAKFILGPEVQELEANLAKYSGASHVVTCGSGTAALTLALLALGLRSGEAVLVPDLSFVATIEPVVLLGGVPIFVDVEPDYLTIDPAFVTAGIAAAAQAGYRAVGIIAVDLYGHPADYKALHETATLHNLWLISDAAQSFGASVGRRSVGSLARVTTTSFFPSKPLGCYGDAGAVFTNDSELAELLRSLRQHGLDTSKSSSLRVGLNSRLDTIQAAVLLCKLDLLEQEMAQRQNVAKAYAQLLHGVVALPSVHESVQSAWAAYTVRTKHRDIIRQYLGVSGIASAVYYPMPFHKQPAYQHFPMANKSCPVAERACEEVLSLPMDPYLNIATQIRIANAVVNALAQTTLGI